MKKIVLEIPIPEYKWVEVGSEYWTPLGTVYDLDHVHQTRDAIEYLQRLGDDAEWLINASGRHIREPLCREIVRSRMRFVDLSLVNYYAEKLSHFLYDYRKVSGLKFADYKFEYRVEKFGKHIQFKTFSMTFPTEALAAQHIAKLYVGGKDFGYGVLE